MAVAMVAAGLVGVAPAWGNPLTSFPVPTAGSQPEGIAAGADGNLWFTEHAGNQIGRITPDGHVTEFPIPTAASGPEGITAAPDGSLWFTENAADRIGHITSSGGVTEYAIPTASAGPNQIAIGSDGDPWFTETDADKIGTVHNGTVAEYAVPTAGSRPTGIADAPDGTLRFTENAGQKVGTITTSGVVTEQAEPGSPTGVVSDSAGDVWLTEAGSPSGVEELPASGAWTVGESFLPTGSQPAGMAIGADGHVWFAETGTSEIGRVTQIGPGGITQYPAPSGSAPFDVAAGPGRTIWFTERDADAIGRLTMTAPSITSAATVRTTPGSPVSFTITTSGLPAPTLSETGTLPSGLTFADNGDGTATISGTPASSAAGQTRSIEISADNGIAPAASQALALTVAPLPGPVAIAPPAIAGSAIEGSTLAAEAAEWSQTPAAISYAWESCNANGAACTAIDGATARMYTVRSSDVGHTIRVVETARTGSGSSTSAPSSARSSATPVVRPPLGVASAGTPQVTGTTVQVPIRCRGRAGSSCTITVTLTVTVPASGSTSPAAVVASRRTRTVTARARTGLAAGRRRTLRVALGTSARRLLTAQHRLKGTLVIGEVSSGKTKTVARRTVVFRHRA